MICGGREEGGREGREGTRESTARWDEVTDDKTTAGLAYRLCAEATTMEKYACMEREMKKKHEDYLSYNLT